MNQQTEPSIACVGDGRGHRYGAARLHEGDEPHFHDWSDAAKSALAEAIWKAENVELTTVGVDIGSSTSHLMFARVHLQRKAQLLSSEFVVVRRDVLWRSPILLTPFLPDYTIDAERLRAFIDEQYRAAGLARGDIDSGAVILTGEALKRTNAEAIARIFAAEAGTFVCASAGHHMESALAAHGGGAVALSRSTHRTILNVDVGGGTTKFALIRDGEILSTCAVAVGGRVIACGADGKITRIEDSARQVARVLGIELREDEALDDADAARIGEALAQIVAANVRQREPAGLAADLLLTQPLARDPAPHAVAFTGGVSEYIFGREQTLFGDIAKPLAERILAAIGDGGTGLRIVDPGQGIRATVIGASQFSVQVSGKTIHVSDAFALPVRNVPVIFPTLARHGDYDAGHVAEAVAAAMARADPAGAIALGIRWHGDPHYHRLRALAEGIAQALGSGAPRPLILMVDGDVGKLLGHILEHEIGLNREIMAIDGIQLREFDFVDIGELMRPVNAVPVIIKSLLFPGR